MKLETIYLSSAQVRARYGSVSATWLTRRVRRDGFPTPVLFGSRRYWRITEIEAWERGRTDGPLPVPLPKPSLARTAERRERPISGKRIAGGPAR